MSDIIVVFLLLGLVIVHAYNTGNGNANQRKHESMYGSIFAAVTQRSFYYFIVHCIFILPIFKNQFDALIFHILSIFYTKCLMWEKLIVFLFFFMNEISKKPNIFESTFQVQKI